MACGEEGKCSLPSIGGPRLEGTTLLGSASRHGSLTSVRSQIYEGFINYCGNLLMTKLYSQEKTYDLFAAKIHCFCSDYRYVYVLAVPDNRISYGQQVYLSYLTWTSFQTRTSKTDRDLSVQSFKKGDSDEFIVNTKIQQVSETNDRTTYLADRLPLKVEILNTDKNSIGGYHSEGTIKQALDTFNTVVYFY